MSKIKEFFDNLKNVNSMDVFYETWFKGFREEEEQKAIDKYIQNNSMKLLGFNSYEEFSNQLDTDLAFRQFVYDFLSEKLVE